MNLSHLLVYQATFVEDEEEQSEELPGAGNDAIEESWKADAPTQLKTPDMGTYFVIGTKLNGMYTTYYTLLKAEQADLGGDYLLQIDALLAAIKKLEEQRNTLRKRIIATLKQEGFYLTFSRTEFYKTTLGIDDTAGGEDQAALKNKDAKKASQKDKRLIDGGQDPLSNMSLIEDPKSSAELKMNDLSREQIPDDDTIRLQARRANWFAEKKRQKAKEESNVLPEILAAIKGIQAEKEKDEAALSKKEEDAAEFLGKEDITRACKASLTSELEAVDPEQRKAKVDDIKHLNDVLRAIFYKKVEIDDARASVIGKRLKAEELTRRYEEARHQFYINRNRMNWLTKGVTCTPESKRERTEEQMTARREKDKDAKARQKRKVIHLGEDYSESESQKYDDGIRCEQIIAAMYKDLARLLEIQNVWDEKRKASAEKKKELKTEIDDEQNKLEKESVGDRSSDNDEKKELDSRKEAALNEIKSAQEDLEQARADYRAKEDEVRNLIFALSADKNELIDQLLLYKNALASYEAGNANAAASLQSASAELSTLRAKYELSEGFEISGIDDNIQKAAAIVKSIVEPVNKAKEALLAAQQKLKEVEDAYKFLAQVPPTNDGDEQIA
eukprot:1292872-Prymnesium_polylepis.1